MAIPTGVCAPWMSPADVECFDDLGLDSGQATLVATFASDILFVLSGSHWPGVCARTARPDLGSGIVWWCERPLPWAVDTWSHLSGLHARDEGREMRLPGPVASITSIVVDGVLLSPGAYQLQGRNRVFRVDGERWPDGQDLTRDPAVVPSAPLLAGSLPAWRVAYQFGQAPPDSGLIAFRSLACEIAMALAGKPCRLPWSGVVTTITRRGVQPNYGSISDKLKAGEVGLPDVDLWLTAARGGPWRPRRPRVGRADLPPRRVVTTWP